MADKVKIDSELEFTIVSLKPEDYRLGLSLTKKPEEVKAGAVEVESEAKPE